MSVEHAIQGLCASAWANLPKYEAQFEVQPSLAEQFSAPEHSS